MLVEKFFSVFTAGQLVLVPVSGVASQDHHVAQSDHKDAFVGGAENDRHLAREVQQQLLMLPHYTVFDDLAFRLDGSKVTLAGAVTNPKLKSEAGSVVKSIEGITGVDNQITVLPLSSIDQQIRRAEFRAIYGDPQVANPYGNRALLPIHIIVKNGHVTLEGVVANQADKNLVNVRAHSVSHVLSVTNNLRVDGPT